MPEAAAPRDPLEILRSRDYVGLLVVAAVIGAPVSAAAYGFLALVALLQHWSASRSGTSPAGAGTRRRMVSRRMA